MTSDLSTFIKTHQTRFDTALGRCLPAQPALANEDLIDAMRYSLLSGGKRIRPILAYASAEAICGPLNQQALAKVDVAAIAVECIHAYSLIHDDLPAMDDDDLRRGVPTCHKAYSEATAILAGDALQTLAFETLFHNDQLSDNTLLSMARELTNASGHRGMVMGQAIDLASVDKQVDINHLQQMHSHKTGALMKAAVIMGAIATESASTNQLKALTDYADAIGLAFQVQDDILDVTADTETLGKPQGADQALNKPTYISLLGLDGAQQKAQQLHQQALTAVEAFGQNADPLRALSTYIIERKY